MAEILQGGFQRAHGLDGKLWPTVPHIFRAPESSLAEEDGKSNATSRFQFLLAHPEVHRRAWEQDATAVPQAAVGRW
jgi:hypothetical protein